MASTYDIGDVVRVAGTFTDTGSVVGDPTTVNFLFDTPTSTAPTTATKPFVVAKNAIACAAGNVPKTGSVVSVVAALTWLTVATSG